MSESATVTVRERLAWLLRTARRWCLTLVLLFVALLVGSAVSLGLFESTSANPRNVLSAGSMTQVNSADDTAFMSARDMVPGSTVDGTVTIGNAGDASGDFTLSVEDIVDAPGPNRGRLSTRLHLRVTDSASRETVYSGSLAGLDVSLGTWDPEEERTYLFEVWLPNAIGTIDDAYQGSEVTATFVWRAVQSQ